MSTGKAEKYSEIPPQYNPKETEDKIYRLWEESGFFNPDKLPGKRGKTFTIVVPPPNVTGSLHLGHALNATIQDILIRKRRMEGYKTLWLPGTDHAGIATQNVVEKDLKKEGKNRHDLGREKFLERVWQWKEKYGNIILDQFKKLGSSMDWTRTRFTMDEGYQKAVEAAFLHYYEKGWIYRAERVINWCPKDQTSLSDLELEYKEVEATLYYIRYPLARKPTTNNQQPTTYIVVATTRPETMLGDAAVAVNPKDERYKKLTGEKVLLPIQNREIPIVSDDAVEKEFGTGAVKVTPSHDLLDAEIAERHNLPRHTVINSLGKMTAEAGAICEGLKVAECREKVVEELKKQGLIEKEEPYTHNVAVCYRCGATIEPIPSEQWFLKMKELAEFAADSVWDGNLKFYPERWKEPYLLWLEHVRDWTISRQIWWGHQIPIWYCACAGSTKTVFAGRVPPKIKCAGCKTEWTRDPDVLDTWFSSALWPFAVFGWPEKTADLNSFYPTAVLSTARDIINLWVGRMVFSGVEFMGLEPFHDVIIHATILTKDGKRMSKSLGTGIDPMTLIEKYGADALRFGLIWQAMGTQDIRWSEEHVLAGKKFANKVWNAARFVLQNVSEQNFDSPIFQPKDAETQEGKAILSLFLNESDLKLQKQADIFVLRPSTDGSRIPSLLEEVNEEIDSFQFGQALHKIYEMFWHTFYDIYFEEFKKQLQNPDKRENIERVLAGFLIQSLKVLHPFMPFLTEEIWSHLPIKDKKLLMVEEWPSA
ncbi:MAG: valine--tRNA ligase [Candidatus Sungiibacteriota bacterium]